MSNYFVSDTALTTRDSIIIIIIIVIIIIIIIIQRIQATTHLHRNSLQDSQVPWENDSESLVKSDKDCPGQFGSVD